MSKRPSKLEKLFKKLRKEGKKDKDIVRIVFQEDLNADIDEIEHLTGMKRLDIGRIKGQVSRHVKSREEKAEEAPTKGVYKEAGDTNELLKHILDEHPDIKERHVAEIMSWAELSGSLHPSQVTWLLSSMRGIDTKTANMVGQKYSLALMKAQREGAGQSPPVLYPGIQQGQSTPLMFPQTGPFGTIQPSWMPAQQFVAPTGQTPTPIGYYSRDDVQKLMREKDRDAELTEMRKSVEALKEELPNMIQKAMPKTEGQEQQFEEVSEYIDAKGKIAHPDNAVSVRIIKRPIQKTRVEKETFFEQLRKAQDQGLIAKPLTFEQMKEMLKPSGTQEETPEVKAIKERLTELSGQYAESVKSFNDLKDEMSKKEREHMESQIDGLQQQISSLSTQLSAKGITTPEGVLATAITEAGKRQPVRVVIEGIERMSGPRQPPPRPPSRAPATAEARGGILKELDKRGLVTHIIQRE